VSITRLESGDVGARFATIRKLAEALSVELRDLVPRMGRRHEHRCLARRRMCADTCCRERSSAVRRQAGRTAVVASDAGC
jgi:hypothetical protein